MFRFCETKKILTENCDNPSFSQYIEISGRIDVQRKPLGTKFTAVFLGIPLPWGYQTEVSIIGIFANDAQFLFTRNRLSEKTDTKS